MYICKNKFNVKNYIKYIPLLGALIGWLAFLAACSAGPSQKPIVTVSIEPQKYLLEQITGDRIEIRTLIANGANPETYDPSLTHVMNLNKSIGFLRMGNIGFEAAILDKIRQENPELPIYNTSLGVVPVTGTHSHGAVSHEAIDPHTWTSVKNAKIIAKNMLVAMTEIDPSNKAVYIRNHERLSHHLDSLDNAIAEKLRPHAGEAFMVWHPSLSYFARDYQLEQITTGNADNKEVSMQKLRETIDHAEAHGAKVFFYQKDFDNRQAETMSEELNITKISINPLAYNWEEQMLVIADALADNGRDE